MGEDADKAEEILVSRARDGDEGSLDELWQKHARLIAGITRRLRIPPREVEDVLQEVFIDVWRGLRTFRGESRFSTWVGKIAVRRCLMYRRKKGRSSWLLLFSELIKEGIAAGEFEDALQSSYPEELYPHRAVLRRELEEIVDHELENIPEKHRLAVWLHAANDMTDREIAELTGWPLGTVRSRIRRAVNKLKGNRILKRIVRGL
jgi:RNA polymerase sigma-70 factor (ECF subfamily)